ncbi:MAG: YqiJ family protein [Sedimenticola sp.]|nr:YqiJ family protein [Sedimenticola sp.]
MFEFLISSENMPFTVSLVLMLSLAVLEGVASLLGFGISNMLDTLSPDIEIEPTIATDLDLGVASDIDSPSALSRFWGWLRIGKVPLLILLIIFLTSFGLSGLAMQTLVKGMYGSLLPGIVIAIPAFLITLPIVRGLGSVLNKIMPRDETDAVTEESLVGLIATITLGTAKLHSPAEAKVRDVHGTTHYVMVEPDAEKVEFKSGSSVLLVQKNGAVFKAIINTNSALID